MAYLGLNFGLKEGDEIEGKGYVENDEPFMLARTSGQMKTSFTDVKDQWASTFVRVQSKNLVF